jgi:hypothetical protein
MMKDKRKLHRCDLPLVIEFKATYGATEYTPGLVKNISCRGLTVESFFSFIQYENLDVRLHFPQSGRCFSLNGDVMWKRKNGDISLAGIGFKKMEQNVYYALADEISSLARMPLDTMLASDNRSAGFQGKRSKERITFVNRNLESVVR